ncbi:repeat domain (List_Bact_rpt), partial [Lachnospiraceae bacterium NE2001]
ADVTDDATYKANYRNVLREYDITFINEGQTYAVGKYSYGTKAATITPTTVPSKNPSKEYVYTFDKWTPDIEDVSKNQTYTASYKKEKRKYNVKFVDFDDTEISSSLYEYGTLDTSIVKPADPSYSVDSVHYHFTGWTPEITNVYGDAVYKATYAPNNYHITFVGKDGVLSETDYPYNTKAGDIKVPDTTVANTAEYTYTFTGWDKQITDVVGDETYIARYDAKKQKYFISFVDEDGTTELKAVTEYEYGTAAADIEKPDDPTKNETPEYIYTFDKWTPEIVEVTGNATYKATYSKTLKKYKVTFVDDDGTVLKEATEYDFGTKAADIVRPAEPSKAETDECTYSFGGWTPEVTDVGTKDVTYTATYTKKIKEYKVTWKDGDGKVLKTDSVKYNEMPSYSGDTPTKKATADTRFKFNNKWTPEIVKVTGDATYTAEFDASKIVMHTLSFDLNGGTLNGKNGTVTIEAEEGTEITIPDAPTREGYKFTYWKGSEYHPGDKYKVEGDHTFTAQWEEIKKETTEQPTTEAPKPAQQPTTEAPKPAEQPTTEAPKPAAPTAVQTGDNVNILLFIVLMAISLLGIISILVLKKKQRYN